MILRFHTAGQLIDALEARLPVLRQIDADALAEHKRAEKETLNAFRQECRAAIKMSYAQVKDTLGWGGIRMERVSCPRSLAELAERQITMLRTTRQQTFTISDKGQWATVHHLLTYDPNVSADMC